MTPDHVLEQLPVSSRAHWQLYTDWCDAVGASPAPASIVQLGRFFAAVPAAPSTAVGRVRALRAAHELLHAAFPVPPTELARPIRAGARWITPAEAVAALPLTRYPVGLVGRRDAFLLLLLDQLHLTRGHARTITEADIVTGADITVAGVPVQKSAEAVSCWRCVVTRWLRVLGPAALGFRYTVREILDPTLFTDTHDCDTDVADDWRVAPVLLPAIDQHGWLNPHGPLTTRAMSAITADRQRTGQAPVDNHPRARLEPSTRRTLQDVANAYDDVDARLAALLLQTATLLADNDDLRRN
ncbi:hypothetical protein [Rathayibacter sp. SD072]|uniref:hypothetical protein n=1 Tax=Rathayibacter sp. SD072 TaxID=2781731 RepID=UPI001A95F138|nr:hypothetical protein [Rathayibacter sp. SD072]MBO0985019.1 hypothetical protein [Rathayibacter sp. SD072]